MRFAYDGETVKSGGGAGSASSRSARNLEARRCGAYAETMGIAREILRDGAALWLGVSALVILSFKFLLDQDFFFFTSKSSLLVCLIGLVGAAVLSYELLGLRFTLLALVGFALILAAIAAVAVAIVLASAGARIALARVASQIAERRRGRGLA